MGRETILPLLIGGGISLVSSLAMFLLTSWYDQRNKQNEKATEQAFLAHRGLQKLVHTFEYIENTARHIDKEFANSERNTGIKEPSSLVRPIIGSGANFEFVETEEIVFLSEGDGDLVARIYEIQKRAMNIDVIVSTYNSLRMDYDNFIENHIVGIDGSELQAELEGRDALIANMRVGRLNQLLGGLIDLLEEDRKTVSGVIEEYLASASAKYPKQFSKASFEIREA
ncbi:hypothetical protein PVW51_17340 [Sulfitobacter sp. PR48]|uniref:hypothetical protein n=1 Tax=Sulfitobacter sp. PR48 TaxID=3028383 RepID=UPI00237B1A70|nr:hypothetical protein [Sulfitobacter sp. PR48]MDD9722471.1 hypothetical protein [Sulfitobacter sp. PR48]